MITINSDGSFDNVQNSSSQLGLINELKRNRANQIVLSIMQKGEVFGIEEIINKSHRRKYSIQVCSERCEYLFLTVKNFREKFYNHSIVLKSALGSRVEEHEKFHCDLETKKTEFMQRNGFFNDIKLKKKQETPFT